MNKRIMSSRRALISGYPVLAAAGATAFALQDASGSETQGAELPYRTVRQFGAIGDGVADDAPAIQAALDSVSEKRGGRVGFPAGTYRIGNGLAVRSQGTELVGEGQPGVSRAQGKGSTQIISDDHVTALTFNPGGSPSHATVGYAMRRFHVLASPGAKSGNGILIQNAENCILEDVTVSDYALGFGLEINGMSGNAQYSTLRNFSAGDCLTGLRLRGSGPNGLDMFGGYFAGLGTIPRAQSVGIHIEAGGTARLFGVRIQGYETGMFDESHGQGDELHGPRFEFCNTCLRIGSAVANFAVFGGSFVNSILGNPYHGNIGIRIDRGATNTFLMPTLIAGCAADIIDNGQGTRWIGRHAP